MVGAIIGDIVGSTYEFNNVKKKDFPLFTDKSSFTDDTILTVAIMDSLLTGTTYKTNLKKYARDYGYMPVWGDKFRRWALRDDDTSTNSFGNGAAMRVSPIAWWFDNFDDMLQQVRATVIVSHHSKEAVKGASAIAIGTWMARNNIYKDKIASTIVEHTGYNLDIDLDKVRRTCKFDATCQVTVPFAIKCFLDSTDFEDAIRLAVSIGGDSDTIAAMTGSIAEAFYGTPFWMWKQASSKLDNNLSGVVKKFLTEMNKRGLVRQEAIDYLKYDEFSPEGLFN